MKIFTIISLLCVLFSQKGTKITVFHHGCEGTCPVYTVTLESEKIGQVHFHQNKFGRNKDTVYFTNPDSVKTVYSLLTKIHFWDLKDSYIGDATYDLPTTTITVVQDGIEKKITFNGLWREATYPHVLDSLSDIIDRIARTENQLIK